MERTEIIKALECCKTTTPEDCIECPYRNKGNSLYTGCVNTLVKDTLSLINELAEENERLRAEKEAIEIFNKDYKSINKRLKEQLDDKCDRCIERERADTVRKMQERLEKECLIDRGYEVLLEGTIDQIAKEMLEGTK